MCCKYLTKSTLTVVSVDAKQCQSESPRPRLTLDSGHSFADKV